MPSRAVRATPLALVAWDAWEYADLSVSY